MATPRDLLSPTTPTPRELLDEDYISGRRVAPQIDTPISMSDIQRFDDDSPSDDPAQISKYSLTEDEAMFRNIEEQAWDKIKTQWNLSGELQCAVMDILTWHNCRKAIFDNDINAILMEFGEMTKTQAPHPIYRLMRYYTPVVWNNVLYPNIEYAMSEYRRYLETGEFHIYVHYINDEVSWGDKNWAYASGFYVSTPDASNSYDIDKWPYIKDTDGLISIAYKRAPRPELVQMLVYGNIRPTEDIEVKLNSLFANLMNQVFFQYSAFHTAIMSVKGPVMIRGYTISDIIHFNRLEIIRDAIRAK